MFQWLFKKKQEPPLKQVQEFTLEDRVHDMQIDLKHMKTKLDYVTFYLQKIEKDGLKVKVLK